MAQAVAAIRRGSIDDVRAAQDLVRAHWHELTVHKDVSVLAPEWDAYAEMERDGRCFVLLACVGEEVVGYSVNFVLATHLQSAGVRSVHNDAIYVAQDHRGGGLGSELMAETQRVAEEEFGAQLLSMHAKEGTVLERILRRTPGFRVQDIVFTKLLGRG